MYAQRSITAVNGQSVAVHGGSAQVPQESGPSIRARVRGVAGRAEALRGGLPFGAVMATAGASALAGRCALVPLVRPLLGLAILQAGWVTARAVARWGADSPLRWRSRWALGPAHEHSGFHTVPLGLAVIASGLLALGAAAATRWPLLCAGICLGAAWLTALIAVARFGGSLAVRGIDLHQLDGTWFLVPAVLLGAAIATDRLAAQVEGQWVDALRVLAAGSAVLGWFGYWVLAVLAGLRIRRHGLGTGALAPWWIAMGCAGLAAAALGQVLHNRPQGLPAQWLTDGTAMSVSAAILLSVPVLLLSARFLLLQCGFRAAAAWPPTFSTAVFAFGALQAGQVLHMTLLSTLGVGAAYATLLFWCVTAVWNLKCACTTAFAGGRR